MLLVALSSGTKICRRNNSGLTNCECACTLWCRL